MNAPDRKVVSGVFDAIDLGLILLDGDRRVIGWNAWIENASGISDAAARGRRLDELFPGRIPPRLATAISQALELGASSLVTHTLHPAILPLRTPAGRQLVHNITVRPSGKRPDLRCLLQILDVTVVAGRERILRERQNARYDAVVGSAPDTILTLDAEGTIQLVNPAAARQFGYSPDELIGHPLSSFLAGPAGVEHGLQGRPRRRSAAPPHRAHGAAQERLAQLSRGVGIEVDERRQNLRHRDPA